MERGEEQMLISGFSEESGVDSLPPRCYSYLQASCRVFVCGFRSPLRGRRDRRSGEIAKQETGAAGEFGEIREDNQRRQSEKKPERRIRLRSLRTGQKRLWNSWGFPFCRIWTHVLITSIPLCQAVRRKIRRRKGKRENMSCSGKELWKEALGLTERLRTIRRDLHRHPELGFQEYRTTEKIREALSTVPGIRFLELQDCPTGVIAELPGESGKTVALRADIDALAISEANTHSYVSENPGVMHACGHDGHVAVLLGAAFLLGNQRMRPNTVRFLFQPAEEIVPSGAPVFLRAGALDGAEAVFGFHLNATSDFGKLGFYDGAVMAGGIAFRITVHGKGGHSAYPEKCVNPIFAACDIVSSLARIRDAIHPVYPCNIVPVRIVADEYDNKIPDTAVVEGRMKYLAHEAREIFCREIVPVVEGCALKNHAKCDLELIPKYPVSWNTPDLGRNVVLPSAEELGLETVRIEPSMGSDDFGYYAEKIPAYYMTFGIRKGADFPIAHTAHFDFDEEILPLGAAQLCACALNFR